ncbi:MAG: NAD(P)/FAD-dependent oxidoreductase [Hydrotalea sp.]|nr:NAD(P)/FAD-dependent oxidoreductase [Hydrotalea sp.]
MRYKKNYETDIAIIGAGPVGLFTVFQAGLLGMKSVLVDSLPELGGQLAALYPEKPIYDIPAFPKILAKTLVDHLVEQMRPMNPIELLDTKALQFTRHEGTPYPLHLATEHSFQNKKDSIEVKCKAIIIAAGAGAFDHKKPPINNLAQFENKSVFYFVKNPKDFKDKMVVIAGGGDSAVDWAINLASGGAKKVIVVHRRDDFRAAPQSVAMMRSLVAQQKIELRIPYQPVGLVAAQHDDSQLRAVTLQHLDGNQEDVAADIFLPFYGFASSLGPLGNWGFTTTNRGQIEVHHGTMQTALPQVYAVGDVAMYEGKYKLIMQGFADAAVACHHIFPLVHGQALHFEHSTTRGLPNPPVA